MIKNTSGSLPSPSPSPSPLLNLAQPPGDGEEVALAPSCDAKNIKFFLAITKGFISLSV